MVPVKTAISARIPQNYLQIAALSDSYNNINNTTKHDKRHKKNKLRQKLTICFQKYLVTKSNKIRKKSALQQFERRSLELAVN